jgi:hypothetical protein
MGLFNQLLQRMQHPGSLGQLLLFKYRRKSLRKVTVYFLILLRNVNFPAFLTTLNYPL